MVSEHGYERAEERLHLGKENADRYFRNALERGKSSLVLKGLERDYIRSKEMSGMNVRLYNANIYIFSDKGIGITVYPVPEWFWKKIFHQGKEIIRNVSYFRNCCDHDEDDIAIAY